MRLRLTAGLLASCLPLAYPAWCAPTEKVLFSFSGAKNGGNPFGSLLQDSAGSFYGTTGSGGAAGQGVVYRLAPPAAGKKAWAESVLYQFKGGTDGSNPDGGLIADSSGALYGTTQWGGTGSNGTVFKLAQAAGKTAWHETVLHRFTGMDGANPVCTLVADAAGNLFGTTYTAGPSNKGTVFELSPPAAGGKEWTFQVIYAFTGGNDGGIPYAGLTRDAAGNLYGSTGGGGTANAGTVYRLTPPAAGQTAWSETALYSFTNGKNGAYPHGGVYLNATTGVLYGTTQAGGAATAEQSFGIVYSLTPPASGKTAWNFAVLYRFMGTTDGADPAAGVIQDASGEIYGTTPLGGDIVTCAVMPGEVPGCGVVYKLTPPASGSTAWAESVLYTFTGGKDGNGAWGGILASNGILYGTTEMGGAHFTGGTVYSVTQ
jgi:uncharacterized repeat protein (TIGR03803 family)